MGQPKPPQVPRALGGGRHGTPEVKQSLRVLPVRHRTLLNPVTRQDGALPPFPAVAILRP